VERYRRVRRFLPSWLHTVTFAGTQAGQPVLQALQFLARLEQHPRADLHQAPLEVVSSAWCRRVTINLWILSNVRNRAQPKSLWGRLRGGHMKRVWCVFAVVSALDGCAMASKTYTPDGRQGYVIDCWGTALTWGKCYEKAGDLCGSTGYEILAQTGDQGAMVAGIYGASVMTRKLVITRKS
jgi:hypothetical protein